MKGNISYSTIGPVQIIGAKQSIYFDTAAVVRNLDIANLTVTDTTREGIRIQGDVNGVTVKNFSLKQVAKPTVAPDLPTGIAIHSGTNIQISDGSASGFQMVSTGYPNGDGISAEGGVSNLTISRVTASDNSDGGFDLKYNNTLLYDLTAERNFRNYRFWSSVKASTLTSVDAANAHIWAGGSADVVIEKLVVKSTTKAVILYVDGAKSVKINACELNVPKGTKLIYKATASSVVILGPGCAL
ncbi:MAG: right-handed parallel beta-helix repeat-containing protein [bacterium]|nr:right-handed parallel beta-helix repeat-containing protein [bacterium]